MRPDQNFFHALGDYEYILGYDPELADLLEYDTLMAPFDRKTVCPHQECHKFLIKYLENQGHIEDMPVHIRTKSGKHIPARATMVKAKGLYHCFLYINPYKEPLYKQCA